MSQDYAVAMWGNNSYPTTLVRLNSWNTWYDASSWPWKNAAEGYNPTVGLSFMAGKHNMKVGGGYNRYTKNQ